MPCPRATRHPTLSSAMQHTHTLRNRSAELHPVNAVSCNNSLVLAAGHSHTCWPQHQTNKFETCGDRSSSRNIPEAQYLRIAPQSAHKTSAGGVHGKRVSLSPSYAPAPGDRNKGTPTRRQMCSDSPRCDLGSTQRRQMGTRRCWCTVTLWTWKGHK